jgi:hypothetical protein
MKIAEEQFLFRLTSRLDDMNLSEINFFYHKFCQYLKQHFAIIEKRLSLAPNYHLQVIYINAVAQGGSRRPMQVIFA